MFKLFSGILLIGCQQILASEDSDSCNAAQTQSASYSSFGFGPTYDEDEAFDALMLAYAAYAPKENLLNWDCGCCNKNDVLSKFTTTHVYEEYANQAYCGHFSNKEGSNTIVLSFRGTSNVCGWVCNDFDMDLVGYPYVKEGLIMEGFYRVWQSVEDGNGDTSYYGYKSEFMPKMIEMLDEFGIKKFNNECEMIITGHSLGAALAQIASLTIADYLKENSDKYKCNIKVYTFGSPRWSNKKLTDYFDNHKYIDQRWRIRNGYDVVTAIPPLLMNFYHTTTQVWYDNGLSEASVGSSRNGELNKDGYNVWDCLSHTKSCINDHLTYLDYEANDGECTPVTRDNIEQIYEKGSTRKQSRVSLISNEVCETLCKR